MNSTITTSLPTVTSVPAGYAVTITRLDPKDVAKLVRTAVKAWFPGVKFSVRTDSYSMGSSVDVSWSGGPAADVVDLIATQYRGSSYDGMSETTSYRGAVLVTSGGSVTAYDLPGATVHTHRTPDATSLDAVRPVAAWMIDGFDESAEYSMFGDEYRDPFGRTWSGGAGRLLLDWLCRVGVDEWTRVGHNDPRAACGVPNEHVQACALAAGHPTVFHRTDMGRPFIGAESVVAPVVCGHRSESKPGAVCALEAGHTPRNIHKDGEGRAWFPYGVHADGTVDPGTDPAAVARILAADNAVTTPAEESAGLPVDRAALTGMIRADVAAYRAGRTVEPVEEPAGRGFFDQGGRWIAQGAALARHLSAVPDLPEVAAVEPVGTGTDPVARWEFLGNMTRGVGGPEKRARWDRYVAAIRRVHGLPDNVAHAELVAARDADPRSWADKCAAYWQAYAELMTEGGAARDLAAEPHPAPAVDTPEVADVPEPAAGPVRVADLQAGDRVHVYGIDQFGSPTHGQGFVRQSPGEVIVKGRTPSGRASKDPKKARRGLLVGLTEHANGWNGYQMTVVTMPDAMAERVTDEACQFRPMASTNPYLVSGACSCGGWKTCGEMRPDMVRMMWQRHAAQTATAAPEPSPAEAEAVSVAAPVEHVPVPAVEVVTADMLAAAEAAGRQAYREYAPGMPGRAAALDSVVRELVEGLPVGGGAADIFAAFNRGYDAAADRRVYDLELSLSISQQQATTGAEIAERNPAAQECADIYAAGAVSVAHTLATVRADIDERAGGQVEPESPADQGDASGPSDADVYTLPLDQYAPELDSDGPDADLTITHDHEGGTVLHGGRKGDGTLEIVRAFGFQWRRFAGVHIPSSRDRFADLGSIGKAAAALREAGHTVAVSIDDVWRPASVREEHRAARVSARAERLADRAVRQFGEANRRRGAAESISDGMPFGEPIKVGHHSEGRHRRAFDRIESNLRASYAAADYAESLANRAAGAQSNEEAKQGARAIMRRIERLEAEARGLVRNGADGPNMDGAPGAQWHRRAALRLEQLREDIAYQRAKLGTMADAGQFVAWAPEHFRVGDWVNVSGRWCEVARINRKSVSVRARFQWESRDHVQPVKWDEIHGRRRDGMQSDTPNGELWSVDDARRVARWAGLVRDLGVNHDRTDPQAVAQRRHTQYARRVVLGLGIMATVQEIDAFGEPDDTAGKRARALAMLAAYERFEAGETFVQVAASTTPIGDTVPTWVMPTGEPVDVLPRDVMAGDVVAGVWDGFAGMRTLARFMVGPVTAAPVEYDRREAGSWVTVTVAGEAHELRSHRWLSVHRAGSPNA